MTPTNSHLADLSVALDLAAIADVITAARFGAVDLTVDTKPDLTPVSDADRAVERAIRAHLAEVRPDDAILGEEFGDVAGSSGRRWVIDPIDATRNFVRGVPVWATLIALLDETGNDDTGVDATGTDATGIDATSETTSANASDVPRGAHTAAVSGEAVVGVVSAPALARRWWAYRDGGAWANEPGGTPRRLAVSRVADLADASLSYSSLTGWARIGRREAFLDLTDRVWRTRAYGDFWSYLLVAEGAADLACEPELSLWDMAALAPIVTAAGGRFTGLNGVDGVHQGNAAASNGLLHKALLAALEPPPRPARRTETARPAAARAPAGRPAAKKAATGKGATKKPAASKGAASNTGSNRAAATRAAASKGASTRAAASKAAGKPGAAR